MPRIEANSANRLAIYCFYDAKGHAPQFIPQFLDDLMKNVNELAVVVNGKLDAASREMFQQYAARIVVRENRGLDAAAYKEVMLSYGWDALEAYDEVICLNDTIMGPLRPFTEMFSAMDARDVDFWGITAYAGEATRFEIIPTHIQSYWHAYRKTLVASPEFQSYWENLPEWETYAEVTHKHEMTFTKHFADLGFTWDTYIDYRKYRGLTPYPMLYMPTALVKNDGCPVFKRRVFFCDYGPTFTETAGQPAIDLYDYLRDETDYNIDLIWDAVLPGHNLDDIRKAMHLTYVLPTRALNPCSQRMPHAAFIYHVCFLDLLDDTCRYLSALPDDVDAFITTTEDKISSIEQYLVAKGVNRKITFVPVVNRGRDVSALYVACADIVLHGGYDVVGFAHDIKSSQNQDNGHHGTESQGFAYKLLENVLASKEYVRNILTLFAENPRLGQVAPPPPYHALYFAHTIENDWGACFDITKELLEETLDIHVPLRKDKSTVSALGSCFWFKVDALRPLFEHGWTYEDFLPEGEMKEGGTISHAIERANGYVCQSQGYYPAWILSDRYARIEIDSLFFSSQVLLSSVGRGHQGESLLSNASGTRVAVSLLRWPRWLWRRVCHAIRRRKIQRRLEIEGYPE